MVLQSTQQYVSKYFALAGDFKGTGEGLLLCNPLKTPSCLVRLLLA